LRVLYEILLYSILGIAACYVLLILVYNISWFSVKTFKKSGNTGNIKVTVIIPVRNESANIVQCLEKITGQSYPSELFEIIVVDDSSSDNTVELVEKFIKENSSKKISIIKLSEKNIAFKKQAINEAIKISKGDLIITTDADCVVSAEWIENIMGYYALNKCSMIIGPVCFSDEKGFFQKIQCLEFLSLIASGAASANIGIPTMCNGANLIYEKKAFIEVGGFDKNKKFASGDDVFLMHKIKKSFGKITFLKNYEALVHTKPQTTFQAFVNQRKRWVSKSRGYSDFSTILTAFIVLFFNLSLIVSFIFAFFYHIFLVIFLFTILSKLIIDFPILMGITSFVKKKKLMYFYFPLQLIYPVYIVFIVIKGLFGKFEWKGRILSNYETN